MKDLEKQAPLPSKDDKKGGRDKSRTVIRMPVLNGDAKIWAGQAVLMLIRLANENNLAYTDDTCHMFNVELMDSILAELGVTPEEIIETRRRDAEETEEQ